MFIYTKHALEKMDSYGLEKNEVQSVVTKGMKWKDENDKCHAQMAGIEVVFSKEENNFVIITVYLAGRLK